MPMAETEQDVNPYRSPTSSSAERDTRKRRGVFHVCAAVVCGAFGATDIFSGVFDLVLALACLATGVEPTEKTPAILLLFSAMCGLILGVVELRATKAWWNGRTMRAVVMTAIAYSFRLLLALSGVRLG